MDDRKLHGRKLHIEKNHGIGIGCSPRFYAWNWLKIMIEKHLCLELVENHD